MKSVLHMIYPLGSGFCLGWATPELRDPSYPLAVTVAILLLGVLLFSQTSIAKALYYSVRQHKK